MARQLQNDSYEIWSKDSGDLGVTLPLRRVPWPRLWREADALDQRRSVFAPKVGFTESWRLRNLSIEQRAQADVLRRMSEKSAVHEEHASEGTCALRRKTEKSSPSTQPADAWMLVNLGGQRGDRHAARPGPALGMGLVIDIRQTRA